jgi:hypothetical protein
MKMRIPEIRQGNSGLEVKTEKPGDGSPNEFSRLLSEESGKIDASATEVKSGTELEALTSLVKIGLAGVQNDFSEDYRKTELAVEGTISRLEKLQLALQEPKEGLKKVEAAIGDLSTGAEELQQNVVSLPENHPLRQMADELAVLAHVESVKYRRGDYL